MITGSGVVQGRHAIECLFFSPSLLPIPEGEQIGIHANSRQVEIESNKTIKNDIISASSLVSLNDTNKDKSDEGAKTIHGLLLTCREAQYRQKTEYELTNRSCSWLLEQMLAAENGSSVSRSSIANDAVTTIQPTGVSVASVRSPDVEALVELLDRHLSVRSADDSLDEPWTGEYDDEGDTWKADILDSLVMSFFSRESQELVEGMIYVRNENREEVAIL